MHCDGLFDFCLFERRRQSVVAYSGPVARFAKLVAEHQLEPALWKFLFPFPERGYEFSRDGNFPYPLLCFGVEPAVFLNDDEEPAERPILKLQLSKPMLVAARNYRKKKATAKRKVKKKKTEVKKWPGSL